MATVLNIVASHEEHMTDDSESRKVHDHGPRSLSFPVPQRPRPPHNPIGRHANHRAGAARLFLEPQGHEAPRELRHGLHIGHSLDGGISARSIYRAL